jgi:hypothetical protein
MIEKKKTLKLLILIEKQEKNETFNFDLKVKLDLISQQRQINVSILKNGQKIYFEFKYQHLPQFCQK